MALEGAIISIIDETTNPEIIDQITEEDVV